MASRAKFYIGQIVHHKLRHYRGVVIDVDPHFALSDLWYQKIARTNPPKDQPWYHILVDRTVQMTYVAERNLEESFDTSPILHPAVDDFFKSFQKDHYLAGRLM